MTALARKLPILAPPADLRAKVAAFNAAHPVGTHGQLIRGGRVTHVATRSRALLRSDGIAVVWFAGINGCFPIDDFMPNPRARS